MHTIATQTKGGDNAAEAFASVRRELALVEAEFSRQASSDIKVVDYLGEYLRTSGGKRVRPALLLLSTYACGGDASAENVVRLATVMEMLHTATLVHDDIIDDAKVRRRRPSFNARFGNSTAVLMGDWLYMSAFETSLRQRSLEILDILTTLTRKMTEGELIQLSLNGNVDVTEEQYFEVLRRKTAYLFSACCEIGSMLGEAPPEHRAALRQYGLELGIAFQLADDLLDVTSTEGSLGKPAGADLLEGKMTLPLILLAKRDPALKEDMRAVIDARTYENAAGSRLRQRLWDPGSLDEARRVAAQFASSATKNLEVLPETGYRSALEAIPRFVLERTS
jgi:octaprenyl-diphosphate synthase